jgi:phosphoribosylanthranilate isomerase
MSALWIKVCGMTTPDAVAAALAARVDAIGFVFAESPRRVTPARAAQLAGRVGGCAAWL